MVCMKCEKETDEYDAGTVESHSGKRSESRWTVLVRTAGRQDILQTILPDKITPCGTDPDLFFLSGGCQGGVSSVQSLPAGSDGLERVKD